MKKCHVCKRSKGEHLFSSDKSRPDNLSARCKSCDSKKSVKYNREVAYPKNKKKTLKMKPLDILFSKAIRQRDGKCMRCGSISNLQCSHVLPRNYLSIRWEMENAITLCVGCHIYWWHKYPHEAVEWFDNMWPGRYEKLKKLASTHKKIDRIAELERLRKLAGGWT